MGTGWTGATALNEIEVRHDERGQPAVGLLGKTGETLSAEGIQRIWISISHLKAIACAVVLIET
jgi:holo-[acyl-carrier protein] synthase